MNCSYSVGLCSLVYRPNEQLRVVNPWGNLVSSNQLETNKVSECLVVLVIHNFHTIKYACCMLQARRDGGLRGGKLPRAQRCLGGRGPPSGRNIKYARMYHFKNKNSKTFSPERPRENVWGPREYVFPGPVVALDGPGSL